MSQAHIDFVNGYFDELEENVNRLIDDQYRPFIISRVLEQDVDAFKSDDPQTKEQSIFNAIQIAFVDNQELSHSQKAKAQSDALLGMKFLYSGIDEQVEKKRNSLLSPLKKQRHTFLTAIRANYDVIIRKNAVLTGLLASIVDVHEAQANILEEAGLDRDLRSKVGLGLEKLSKTVTDLRSGVESASGEISNIENQFKETVESLNNVSLKN